MSNFSIYSPYEDVEDIVDINRTECFVCYEILKNNTYPINLKTQKYYIKQCECDGTIHKICLDRWYNVKHTCPICRTNIRSSNETSAEEIAVAIDYITLNMHIIGMHNNQLFYLMFCFKIICEVLRACSLGLTIYVVYTSVFYIFYVSTDLYNRTTYIYNMDNYVENEDECYNILD